VIQSQQLQQFEDLKNRYTFELQTLADQLQFKDKQIMELEGAYQLKEQQQSLTSVAMANSHG
jgi:hypothetical protein